MSFRVLAVSVCTILITAIGCGGDSKDESNGSATQPTSAPTPPAGDILIRDPQDDAAGPAEGAKDIDLRSVSLLRKRDILITRLRFWRAPKGDVVVLIEFEAGGRQSEVRVVRRAGQLGVKRGPGQPIEDAKIEAAQGTIDVQLPLDRVTSKPEFGFRAVAKSEDGASLDSAPDAPAEFPSGRER